MSDLPPQTRKVLRRAALPRRGQPPALEHLKTLFQEAVYLHRAHEFAAAAVRYRSILREAPDLGFVTDNLCQALLASGDYGEGFKLYDVRFTRRENAVSRPHLPFPEWRGETIDGKSITVLPEQGFGDQIMFSRFSRDLLQKGARVTLLTPPELVRTFQQLGVAVVPVGTPLGSHDFWCMVGSLPSRLGLTLERLSGDPYLSGGSGSAGIGVAWSGRPTHHNDAQRSLPEHLAAELLSLPGAVDLSPFKTGAKDFEDTAQLIRSLKVVISVDTAVAHLSGAMGTHTLCLVPDRGTDWRWMTKRTDTPWYRTMELVRSGPSGWEEAVHVAKAKALNALGLA